MQVKSAVINSSEETEFKKKSYDDSLNRNGNASSQELTVPVQIPVA